ncbi:MAG: single-stranded DNA-binding protein [Actinomycetota bacterium]
MANNTNSITVVGNLTRDPEMRYTATGISTATFGVAVNRSWRNQQTNEWEERTSFFNIVCWRQLADNVSASLKKGMRVVVTGRLEQRSWETEQKEKRSVVEIVADEVGPSLVFATAEVHRVERAGPDAQGRPPQQQQPAAVPSGGGGSGGYDEYGEEPF